jgi:O-antigen/teichoic acid export membrane protein
VASFAAGLIGVWRAARAPAREETGWRDVAGRYRKFPLYSLPGALLDVVGYSVCIWVVASFYGQRAAGEYSQIQRLIGAPLMLVSISLGQILLRHTAELAGDVTELRRLLHRLLRVMGVAAAAALLVLALAGKPIISAMLGPRWHVEHETVVLLGAAVFVRACISPLSSTLITLRRFGLALAWQAAYFCSASLLMPLVASRVGLGGYVRFYVLHELAFYGAYLYLILSAVRALPCAESSAS